MNDPRCPTGFSTPNFKAHFDVDAFTAAIPDAAGIRGIFLNNIIEHAPRVAKKRHGFHIYPAREFVEVGVAVANAAFPELTLGEAFRKFGSKAFPAFVDTLVGKAMLSVMLKEFHDVLELSPRAFAAAGTLAVAEYRFLSPTSARIELRNCFDVPQFHEVGVFEGVLRHYNVNGAIFTQSLGPGDLNIHLDWSTSS